MKITSYTQARARDFGFINVVLPYYHACLLCKLIKLCTFAVVYHIMFCPNEKNYILPPVGISATVL